MSYFTDGERAIGKDARMTARGSRKPDTPAVGGKNKKKQVAPVPPKVPQSRNFRANPRFREAEQVAQVLVTAKDMRDSAARSETGLADMLNSEADRLLDELKALEKGLSPDEQAELNKLSAGQPFSENRKAVMPRF
jgi:hypothetical protein